jgi:DNA polymerase III delta prime subunit
MNMPISLDDFVITRHAIQMPLLRRLVARPEFFPQPHNNTLLLHGSYGSGKTLLASMLPALIEHARATPADQQAFNYVYSYMGAEHSITPAQLGQERLHAVTTFHGCGGESAQDRQRALASIRNHLRHGWGWGWAQTQYRFFIFDEIDELLKTQSDLKSLISSAPADAVFILTTNHIDRVDPGLVSRSTEIEMARVAPPEYLPVLRYYYPTLAGVSDQTLLDVVAHCQSDWRRIKRAMDDIRAPAAA